MFDQHLDFALGISAVQLQDLKKECAKKIQANPSIMEVWAAALVYNVYRSPAFAKAVTKEELDEAMVHIQSVADRTSGKEVAEMDEIDAAQFLFYHLKLDHAEHEVCYTPADYVPKKKKSKQEVAQETKETGADQGSERDEGDPSTEKKQEVHVYGSAGAGKYHVAKVADIPPEEDEAKIFKKSLAERSYGSVFVAPKADLTFYTKKLKKDKWLPEGKSYVVLRKGEERPGDPRGKSYIGAKLLSAFHESINFSKKIKTPAQLAQVVWACSCLHQLNENAVAAAIFDRVPKEMSPDAMKAAIKEFCDTHAKISNPRGRVESKDADASDSDKGVEPRKNEPKDKVEDEVEDEILSGSGQNSEPQQNDLKVDMEDNSVDGTAAQSAKSKLDAQKPNQEPVMWNFVPGFVTG